MYYNTHGVIQRDYHVQIVHHYHMNKLHDYVMIHVTQSGATHYHLRSHLLHYMLRRFIRIATCYLGPWYYMFACADNFHYGREVSQPINSSLVSMMTLGNSTLLWLAYAVQECDKISATFAARCMQVQDNYDHMMLVSRERSAVGKGKYYHSF